MIYNKRNHDVPADAVYVGRPSIFGNPYTLGKDGSRDEVIAWYEAYLEERVGADSWFALEVKKLAGKDLVCWCAPAACHAEVLERWANELEAE